MKLNLTARETLMSKLQWILQYVKLLGWSIPVCFTYFWSFRKAPFPRYLAAPWIHDYIAQMTLAYHCPEKEKMENLSSYCRCYKSRDRYQQIPRLDCFYDTDDLCFYNAAHIEHTLNSFYLLYCSISTEVIYRFVRVIWRELQ